MGLRYRAARGAALMLSAAVALLVTAPPASAGTVGEFIGSVADGTSVKIGGQQTRASLLGLRLEDGAALKTYCVELDVLARAGARMAESPWSEYPDAGEQFNVNRDRILWILHNSYPNVELDALAKKINVAKLEKADAIGGTQAAIWHLSNGAKLDNENSASIRALYDYLTGPANVGIKEQPVVSLSIAPAGDAVAGKAAGPFTVNTTAAKVELKVQGPEGVAVVDANGKPLTEVANGVQFWLSAPAEGATGEATVKGIAKAKVEKGRLFVGVDNKKNPTQTLISADSAQTTVKVDVGVKWLPKAAPPPTTTTAPTTTVKPVTTSTTPSNAFTVAPSTTQPPAPQGGLAQTGASVMQAIGVAMLLFGAGIGMLLLQRRRRRTS